MPVNDGWDDSGLVPYVPTAKLPGVVPADDYYDTRR